ncbi:MAG: hypothetical protein WC370_09660 [Dehalococcoidales bacterium]|jgi:uncharacterized membrane protein YbjE (DUF340 family)
MKEKIQEQITDDLKQASRTDTTITIIAIIVTFVLSGLALGFSYSTTNENYHYMTNSYTPEITRFVQTYAVIIMFVSLAAIISVNWFSIAALFSSKKRKEGLAEKLAKLYQEEGLSQYIDDTNLTSYKSRRNIYAVILGSIASVGVILPLVVFINKVATGSY